MRRFITTILIASTILWAKPIVLTKQQIANWQIKTKKIVITKTIPLGEYLATLHAPASMIYSISLPFAATITQLAVAEYDLVKKGDLLAKVTAKEWIKAQNALLRLNIDYLKTAADYRRKSKLCKEGIIPNKECLYAKAQLQTASNALKAQKSLLQLYGATPKEIATLLRTSQVQRFLLLRAPQESVVSRLFVAAGSVSEASQPLMQLIGTKKKILDIYLPFTITKHLKTDHNITITFASHTFTSQILSKSKILESQNQTQRVRFAVPKTLKLPLNYKADARIEIPQRAVKIPKIAVIYMNKKYYVFKKDTEGFVPLALTIVAEDANYFYANPNSLKPQDRIVVEGAMALKGMMEDEND